MSEQKTASYTGLRSDVLSMIQGSPSRVFDVGCSNGTFLEYVKSHWNVEKAVGIDFDDAMLGEAAQKADHVYSVDLDTGDWRFLNEREFDLIVFADILEQTKNPQTPYPAP